MLDISDIEMIRTIGEQGSMNRACEILHITQSTLSKKLGRLESKLNIELFHRNSGGMVATQAANYIIRSGEPLHNQVLEIERHLELMNNMQGVQVNIGVGHSVESIFLLKVLSDYVQTPQPYTISATTDSPTQLIAALRKGSIDLAVSPLSPEDIPDDLTTALHFSEKLVAVVRPDHPLLNQNASSWKSNSGVGTPFVAPSNPQHWSQHLQDFLKYYQITTQLMCDSYEIATHLVKTSDYFTAGPMSLFAKDVEEGLLVTMPLPQDVLWHCCAIGKPEVLLMPAVDAVLKSFAKYMVPE